MMKTVCFMHMSKSGGSSIRQFLKKQYDANRIYQINGRKDIEAFQYLDSKKKEKLEVVAGHFGMGFYRKLGKNYQLFTMLRNPVERIMSHYYYVNRTPVHEFHKLIQSMSLIEYALYNHDKDIDNGYVRQLSGIDFPIGQCSEKHLETAKTNFSKYISAYGLTEYFDESIEKFASNFGWNKELINTEIRMNVTPADCKKDIDFQDQQRIAYKNRFDVALYDWAADHFFDINR